MLFKGLYIKEFAWRSTIKTFGTWDISVNRNIFCITYFKILKILNLSGTRTKLEDTCDCMEMTS